MGVSRVSREKEKTEKKQKEVDERENEKKKLCFSFEKKNRLSLSLSLVVSLSHFARENTRVEFLFNSLSLVSVPLFRSRALLRLSSRASCTVCDTPFYSRSLLLENDEEEERVGDRERDSQN